jgi:hypothetical protein
MKFDKYPLKFSYRHHVCGVAHCSVVGRGTMLKTDGRVLDSRWGNWIFQFAQSFQPHYAPGIDSASNRNEYQEYS